MRPLSAFEAIGPAWERTRSLLFHDRRIGRILKICLVAVFSQMSGFNANLNTGHGTSIPPAIVPLLLVAGLVGLAISIGLWYLGSRLQFVLLDMLVLRDDRVAPSWERHGRHTWRWMGAKAVVLLALLVLLSPLFIPVVIGFVRLLDSSSAIQTSSASFNFSAFRGFATIFCELVAIVCLLVALFRLFTTLALPGAALENLSFGQTFQRAWVLFQADPGATLLFAVVQPLVLLGFGIAGLLGWAVAVAVPALPFAFLVVRLWHSSSGNTGLLVLLGLIGSVGALCLLVWALATYLLLVGSLVSFAEAYSLYFVGGRYPLLGSYLQPEPEPRLGFPETWPTAPAS